MQRRHGIVLLVIATAFAIQATAQLQPNLRVGAAKVSITPQENFFPFPQAKRGFVGVHDPIFARAIVVDDGTSQIAMVGIDFSTVPGASDLPKRIGEELGIPADHVMVTATHDHNTPLLGGPNRSSAPNPKLDEWIALAEQGAVDAARQARAALQPARVGFGTGKAYVNVNRDELVNGRWHLGYNPERPSDKTVAVIRFENLAGEPIAIYANYAVHGVVMFQVVTKGEGWEVSGDLPGNTSRYVEDHYGKGTVALWTSGAAADQNPVYMALYNQEKPGLVDEGPAGYALLDVQSRRLGEEVVRVADTIKPASSPMSVWGARKMVSCPGQRIAFDQASGQFTVTPKPPVDIPLSVLTIGDIALPGVAGEVETTIGWHLMKSSPFPKTILVTHAGPSIGYIPDDASYPLRTFEVTASPLKEGCSEDAIVNGLVDLMKTKPR
jgi:hypothetical protein